MIKKTKASYWHKLENLNIQCQLCPNLCVIDNNHRGVCRTRINENGVLYTETYGNICSTNIDPIEKKPLFHFYPNTKIYSIGCNSCNLSCQFCQNYEISQYEVPILYIAPDKLLDMVLKSQAKSIAFTYSEPLMMTEYLLDCLPLFKQYQIKTVLVSNSFINEKPLLDIIPYVDAWNVDFKSISNDFYHNICSADLDIVKRNIKIIANNAHLEISFLLIPTLNDSDEEVLEIASFIKSINPNIPLHINRYHPAYKMQIPATPIKTLVNAYDIAKTQLKYVYIGNIGKSDYNQTYCPNCNTLLIDRNNSVDYSKSISNNICSNCNHPIYGHFCKF